MEPTLSLNPKKTLMQYLLWFIFISFIIFAAALPGIELPGIGLLYPFRMCLPFVFFYCVLFKNNNIILYNQIYWMLFGVFAFMFVWGICTLAWAPSASEVLKHLINYLLGFILVYCLIVLVGKTDRLYHAGFICLIIMLCVMMCGVYEGLTGNYLFSDEWADKYPYANNDRIHYAVVCFGNPNDMIFTAIGLMPFINMSLKYIFRGQNRKWHFILSGVYYLLTFVNATLSSCRMGILLLIGVAFLGLFFNRNINVRRIALLGVCCLVIAALMRFQQIIEIVNEESRIKIWLNIVRNAEHYFFLGMGPGTSYLTLPDVEYVGTITNPHFWFLEIFAEFGVVVFVVILSGYMYIGYKSWRIYHKAMGEARDLSSATLKFIIYFIPMNIMSSSISAMPCFWLMIAFAIISVTIADKFVKAHTVKSA